MKRGCQAGILAAYHPLSVLAMPAWHCQDQDQGGDLLSEELVFGPSDLAVINQVLRKIPYKFSWGQSLPMLSDQWELSALNPRTGYCTSCKLRGLEEMDARSSYGTLKG